MSAVILRYTNAERVLAVGEMEKMYISIDKAWFDKNAKKLESIGDKEFGQGSGKYLITDDIVQEAQPSVIEIDKKEGVTLDFKSMSDEITMYCDWKPTTDHVVVMVENEIDNIKGDAFVRIVELLIKRLNKFKAFIESVKNL